MIEDLGGRWLAGEAIDPTQYATLTNAERRLFEVIGLQRRARDVSPPSVAEYLAHKAKQREAAP